MSVEVAVEDLALRAPFRISGYTFHSVPVAVVTVSEGGHRGRGEAAGVYYLEDTPAQIASTVESHRPQLENGITREELAQLLPIGGARNAIDCALWDLEARRTGRPVWQLAGLSAPEPRLTTFTLGADDPATIVAGARQLPHAQALKLKLSGDLEADIARVQALRAARPDVWLGVDANQGYTLDSLARLLPTLVEAHVLLLEQPLRRGAEADLAGFECPIPIAADESVQGLADVDERLVGRFDVVNVKLDKCGGLTEALQMARKVRALGLKLMVGNMVGTSLAMAPAFAFAQLCDYVDLDGPTFLRADREPALRYEAGRVWCPPDVWG
jgi:L-alanine-DL-glutamate epimerase-like enolase superfamily enzyme